MYLLASFIYLLFGIASILVVTFGWRPQRSKSVMVALIAIVLIIKPLMLLILFGLISGTYAGNSPLMDAIFFIINYFPSIANLFGCGLFLAYLLMRRTEEESPSLVSVNGPYDVLKSQEDPQQYFMHAGPVWSTELTNEQRNSVVRRREWGFLIDFIPGALMVCGGFTVATTAGYSGGFNVIPFIIWLVITGSFMLYIPFKDCLGGVSVGKKLSGCRVVDQASGRPIGVGQSLARNLPFLIPLFPLIEIVVVNLRSDKRRLGDLLASTIVVSGPAAAVDGIPVKVAEVVAIPQAPNRHPLDD